MSVIVLEMSLTNIFNNDTLNLTTNSVYIISTLVTEQMNMSEL